MRFATSISIKDESENASGNEAGNETLTAELKTLKKIQGELVRPLRYLRTKSIGTLDDSGWTRADMSA